MAPSSRIADKPQTKIIERKQHNTNFYNAVLFLEVLLRYVFFFVQILALSKIHHMEVFELVSLAVVRFERRLCLMRAISYLCSTTALLNIGRNPCLLARLSYGIPLQYKRSTGTYIFLLFIFLLYKYYTIFF